MRLLKCEKGLAMPLALMVMVVLLLLGTALWQYSVMEVKQVVREEENTKAYYLARAGADTLAHAIIDDSEWLNQILTDGDNSITKDTSLPNTLETDYLGEAGRMSVSIETLGDSKIRITGIGETGADYDVKQIASIVLETEPFFDTAAVVTTGAGLVDFDPDMEVKGDIIAGGPVNLPTDYDEDEYKCIPNYPFPEDRFARVEIPDTEGHDVINEGNINLSSPFSVEEFDAGKYYTINRLRMQNGTIEIDTTDELPTILVINTLNVTGGEIKVTGNGDADIYLNPRAHGGDQHMFITPNMTLAEGTRLNFYLTEGCNILLIAHNPFEGLIYGPYDTNVAMQAHADFTGAMIVESLTAQGSGAIGGSGSKIEYERGFEHLGIKPGVKKLYWEP